MASITPISDRRELAYRSHDGIHVSLFWNPADDTVTVEVLDLRSEDFFTVAVHPRRALDAFNHPYAYRDADEASPEPEYRLAA
jgi:hypothetical protein